LEGQSRLCDLQHPHLGATASAMSDRDAVIHNQSRGTYDVAGLVALVAGLGLSLHAALRRDVTLLAAVWSCG
jgi:hypothetical protein